MMARNREESAIGNFLDVNGRGMVLNARGSIGKIFLFMREPPILRPLRAKCQSRSRKKVAKEIAKTVKETPVAPFDEQALASPGPREKAKIREKVGTIVPLGRSGQ
jgi:hypothetical protein